MAVFAAVRSSSVPTDTAAAKGERLPFLQSMADCPRELLDIQAGQNVTFDAASMALLARCRQVRELDIPTGFPSYYDEAARVMDWINPALFASFTPNRLPHVLSSCQRQSE